MNDDVHARLNRRKLLDVNIQMCNKYTTHVLITFVINIQFHVAFHALIRSFGWHTFERIKRYNFFSSENFARRIVVRYYFTKCIKHAYILILRINKLNYEFKYFDLIDFAQSSLKGSKSLKYPGSKCVGNAWATYIYAY